MTFAIRALLMAGILSVVTGCGAGYCDVGCDQKRLRDIACAAVGALVQGRAFTTSKRGCLLLPHDRRHQLLPERGSIQRESFQTAVGPLCGRGVSV